MNDAAMPKQFKVYKVIIRNAREQIVWRFEVAAPDRRHAQDAGSAWVQKYSPDDGYHRVSVMRKIKDREPATMYVVAG